MIEQLKERDGLDVKPEKALIFELSREGRKAYSLPQCDVPLPSLTR